MRLYPAHTAGAHEHRPRSGDTPKQRRETVTQEAHNLQNRVRLPALQQHIQREEGLTDKKQPNKADDDGERL